MIEGTLNLILFLPGAGAPSASQAAQSLCSLLTSPPCSCLVHSRENLPQGFDFPTACSRDNLIYIQNQTEGNAKKIIRLWATGQEQVNAQRGYLQKHFTCHWGAQLYTLHSHGQLLNFLGQFSRLTCLMPSFLEQFHPAQGPKTSCWIWGGGRGKAHPDPWQDLVEVIVSGMAISVTALIFLESVFPFLGCLPIPNACWWPLGWTQGSRFAVKYTKACWMEMYGSCNIPVRPHTQRCCLEQRKKCC